MIEVKALCKVYGSGETAVSAVKNADLKIDDGEMVALIGKSGSGKSTLLHLLGGLDTPTSGSILYDGEDITKLDDKALAAFRLTRLGFVFQFYDLLAELTAEENILLPARLAGRSAAHLTQLAQQLGIADRLTHYPAELSGGQQQRVAIARALINQPRVLLCDEPTGHLDAQAGREVMELLTALNRSAQCTVVIVTHDADIAQSCGRIVRIEDGRIFA